MQLTQILKGLGDGTRLRILNLLRIESLCVCEIEEILKITQSNASRHLNKLKDAGIIRGEKHAQWVYYGMNEGVFHQYSFIKSLLEEDLAKQGQSQKDITRLKLFKEQKGGCDHIIKLAE